MSATWLPTLAGFARLTPLKVIAQNDNVAGSSAIVEYTVPTGRMALITHLGIAQNSGTAYTKLGFAMHIAGAGTGGPIIEDALIAVLTPVHSEAVLWLTETDEIRSVVRGGDATSDYRIYIGGAEFDWVAIPDV